MTGYTREQIVDAARSMLGVEYVHQGRDPKLGVDCIGLLICVARQLGDDPHDFTEYGMLPRPEVLLEHIAVGMDEIPVGDAGSGDVYCFWSERKDGTGRMIRAPRHFGIITPLGMVHALLRDGELSKVTEHSLNRFWKKRIHSVWRFKGLVGVPA